MKVLKDFINYMAKEKNKKDESKKKVDENDVAQVVDLLNPAFDPDIPEQKQRHFR